MPTSNSRRLSRSLIGLVLATPLCGLALANEPHGEPAAAAKPLAKPLVPKIDPASVERPTTDKPGEKPAAAKAGADAAPAAAADAHGAAPAAATKNLSMEQLRQRVAEKVAAVRAAQATPEVRLATAAPHGRAGTTAGKAMVHLAAAHAAVPGAAGAAHGAHWMYSGENGPESWGSLKPEFATCSIGKRQSPIDIRGGVRVDLEPIKFSYGPTPFAVVDNGHTVQVNVNPGNSIQVNGRQFDLVQFHFHRPSEERINGRQYPMVAHLVHKDLDGRLAVVAVLMDQGRAHPMVQLVWNSLPLEQNEPLASPVPIDMSLLLPDDRRYYTYIGSLTTPPCSEGVLWLVLKQPAVMSPEQVAVFARLYPMNARPIQSAADRLIKESN